MCGNEIFRILEMPSDRYAFADAVLKFEGTPAPTPEPASLLLLSGGTIGLIVRRRAFRKGEAR